jgi:hypothetical protein
LRGTSAVLPPPVGARADDVRAVDDEHLHAALTGGSLEVLGE